MENHQNPTQPEKTPRKRINQDPHVNSNDEQEESEINPAKLDREPSVPDSTGNDGSKPHQPYELKDKPKPGKLVGQGGYGTSGTSGNNSKALQGYQNGRGSAGSQNGSTGYNSGSLGMGRGTR